MILTKVKEITVCQMTEFDEENFQKLLLAVYGKTYSYKYLYESGGYSSLINKQDVLCFGQFNSKGKLIGHTGFIFSDENFECKSCLSMRIKDKEVLSKIDELIIWETIMTQVSKQAKYLYQNTTSYHLKAQIYAHKILRAIPTGFILNYTIGEKYQNLATPDFPMQALCQTTILNNDKNYKKVRLIDTHWKNWLLFCFDLLNRNVIIEDAICNNQYKLQIIEYNKSLDLSIRDAIISDEPFITQSKARVDIIYIPTNTKSLFIELLKREYLPIGVKPNYKKDDELVFQLIPVNEREKAIEYLKRSKFFSNKARLLIKGWIELCEETI